MSQSIGIVVFPGSNCDHDAHHALSEVMGADTRFIWHKEKDLSGIDLLLIPGGFSFGDYLRTGAIARFSPVMQEVIKFAEAGMPVIGICNGFQILLESKLLPGVMLHNENLRFICKDVHLRVENSQNRFISGLEEGDLIRAPIAHGQGNYFIDAEGLSELRNNRQILFRYCDEEGITTPESNVNGSTDHIAGICNKEGNVLGMMPHPERAVESLIGSGDGVRFFESVLNQLSVV